jgi:hydrogenase maturation protein HypF
MAAALHEEPSAGGSENNRRVLVRVRGIVQGVGFRPYIFQLAHQYGLGGCVSNQADGVEIVIAGAGGGVEGFLRDLPAKAPPLAKIVQVEVSEQPFEPIDGFTIVKSVAGKSRSTLISPDVCTCDDCLREFSNPEDRRYRYPFTNCTNCGPRYTIIKDIPYDRDKTTMAGFPMCPSCLREYEDPMNRRFHAQPNACWECGPQVWLEAPDGRKLADKDDAVREAIRLLNQGAILAVKGLGGFHLAVHALDEEAVSRLRSRKIREEKPFAVMFANLDVLKRYCCVNAAEESLLTGLQRPIVLLERLHRDTVRAIAAGVAPGNRFLGAFLPYTPLHFLLFADSPCDALIMTSGNQSDEPIVMDNESARGLLGSIADCFLLHDRDIYLRCDDSVTRVFRERPYPLRRARGYVPVPVFLAESLPPVLGVGAELKSTICLVRNNEAFLSQHIGDLENLETLHSFEQVISHFKRILETEPQVIVHDLHPDYLSTQWALTQEGFPRLAVQHHHAHIASVMAERKLSGPVLGLALDGTGYGTDGTIWGGEILRVDGDRFERLGHFRHVPLPGGDKAIKEPWRIAASYLWSLDPPNAERTFADILGRWQDKNCQIVLAMLERNLNSPLTSSCGRLFDAVSALAGVRDVVHYEGQAAIELEQAIEPEDGSYRGELERVDTGWIVDPFPMILEVVADARRGRSPGIIAARFHNGLVALLVAAAEKVSGDTGLTRIVLSGGVFQNVYLLERLEQGLEKKGLEVWNHLEVPANDACIALGQAHIGGQWLKRQMAGKIQEIARK